MYVEVSSPRKDSHNWRKPPPERTRKHTKRMFSRHRYEDIEYAPFSYNAGGVKRTQDRAQELTDPEVLAEHGGGDLYPLYFAERAENGNFLESNEIAKRHGVCGDPRLVRGNQLFGRACLTIVCILGRDDGKVALNLVSSLGIS